MTFWAELVNSLRKNVLIAFAILLSLSVLTSFIIGYEIGSRKQEETGEYPSGITVEYYKVDDERNLEIQLKNTRVPS